MFKHFLNLICIILENGIDYARPKPVPKENEASTSLLNEEINSKLQVRTFIIYLDIICVSYT